MNDKTLKTRLSMLAMTLGVTAAPAAMASVDVSDSISDGALDRIQQVVQSQSTTGDQASIGPKWNNSISWPESTFVRIWPNFWSAEAESGADPRPLGQILSES